MLLFAMLGTLMAPPPAEDVACIVRRVPDSALIEMIREVRTGGTQVREQIRQATFACGRQGGWDEARMVRTGQYAAASMLHEQFAVQLRAVGMSPETVDRWLHANGLHREGSEVTEAMIDLLRESLRAAQVPDSVFDAHPELLGGYIAARRAQLHMDGTD